VAARDPEKRFSSLGNAMAALRIVSGSASGRPPRLDNYSSPKLTKKANTEPPNHTAKPSAVTPSGLTSAKLKKALIAVLAMLLFIAVGLFVMQFVSRLRGQDADRGTTATPISTVPAEAQSVAPATSASSVSMLSIDIPPTTRQVVASVSAPSLPAPMRKSAPKTSASSREISPDAPLPKKRLDKLEDLGAGKALGAARPSGVR
jgi:hypothetical protein